MSLRHGVAVWLIGVCLLFSPIAQHHLKAEDVSVDLYYDLLDSDDETVRENGIRLILAREPKNRKALENYLELEEERGNYREAIEWAKRLHSAGALSKAQAEERTSLLEERVQNQEHLSIWENRLDRFRQKEQYSLALSELRKLRAWYVTRKSRSEKRLPDLTEESGEFLEATSQRKNARYYLSLYDDLEKEIVAKMKE